MGVDVQNSNCFFAIELPDHLGLSDKLWHLSKLYCLGRALSYTYVHTPFRCVRSSSASYAGMAFLRYASKAAFGSFQVDRADYVGRFLGLESRELNISDSIFKNYSKTKILLDEVFEATKISDLDKLKEIIGVNSSESDIKLLTTDRGIYAYVDEIDRLLNKACKDKNYFEELELSKYYWLCRKEKPIEVGFLPNKIKILVHIRNGDTATFRVGEKTLSVFASSVRIIETEDDILDATRKPIPLKKISCVLEEIFQTYTQSQFSVVLISDGYRRTLEVILRAMVQRKIRLSPVELLTAIKQIHRAKRELKTFSNYGNISTIVGESRQNLLKSIHAIADADIVICSSGGFAYIVHTFFKRGNQATVVLNATSYSSNDLQAIGDLIELRLSEFSD